MGEQDEVEKEFYEYFQNLFTSSNLSQNSIQVILDGMQIKVTPKMNA